MWNNTMTHNNQLNQSTNNTVYTCVLYEIDL